MGGPRMGERVAMVELIRVVAVSPGDVQAERDVLEKVVEEIVRICPEHIHEYDPGLPVLPQPDAR